MAGDRKPRTERDLFDLVVDLPEAERETRLRAESDDDALIARVLRLAAASDLKTSRASKASRHVENLIHETLIPSVAPGQMFGVWKLVEEIGRGGMGAVYRVERNDGHFRQHAALKVLSGLPTPEALARLASERQILASLSHPNIARLIDGGATEEGQPWLVMEQVDGVPLDVFLAASKPSRARFLTLFLEICDTVSFAHARLVVHCDLKPSNILVTPEGRPVLLDFGIAQLLAHPAEPDDNPKVESDPIPTDAAAPPPLNTPSPHTPRYASPEQRAGGRIGTGTDVHALGRILAECIDRSAPAALHAIAACASAPDPTLRYASVDRLSLDLRRCMAHQPVDALPLNVLQRTGLLMRRRWPVFVSLSILAIITALFTVQVVRERDRALLAETRARQESEAARATNTFLLDLFRGADPESGGGRQVTALSLVDQSKELLDRRLEGQPELRITMLDVLSGVYLSLGEPDQAESLLTRALAEEAALANSRPEQRAGLKVHYARLLAHRLRHAEAERPARDALALIRAIDPIPPDLEMDSLAALADVEAGLQHAQAAAALLDELSRLQERHGVPIHERAMTTYAIGTNWMESGDAQKALPFLEDAARVITTHYGDQHPRTLQARQSIGVVYGRLERLDEAEVILRDVLARQLSIHGERSNRVASVQRELAYLLMQQGHYIESARFTEEVLAHDAAVEGAKSPAYARTLNNLAFAQMNMGDVERAVTGFRSSIELRQATLPPGDLAIARAQNNLARLLISLGRLDEAEPLVTEALASRSAHLPVGAEERLESLLSMMEWSRRRGDIDRAGAIWAEVEPHLANVHAYTQLEGARGRAWLAVSRKEPDARALIDGYISRLKATMGNTNPAILRGEVAQAEMYSAFGLRAEALNLAQRLQRDFRALPDAYPPGNLFEKRLAVVIQTRP